MKKYRVITAPAASRDILSILDYFENENDPELGMMLANAIYQAIKELAHMPLRFQTINNIDPMDTRVFHRCLVFGYSIFYMVDVTNSIVRVYRVLHQRQEIVGFL